MAVRASATKVLTMNWNRFTLGELCLLLPVLGLGQPVQTLDHLPFDVEQVFLTHLAK